MRNKIYNLIENLVIIIVTVSIMYILLMNFHIKTVGRIEKSNQLLIKELGAKETNSIQYDIEKLKSRRGTIKVQSNINDSIRGKRFFKRIF